MHKNSIIAHKKEFEKSYMAHLMPSVVSIMDESPITIFASIFSFVCVNSWKRWKIDYNLKFNLLVL